MQIEKEYINSIAPDKASLINAQKIFSKNSWSIESSQRALWTQISGSGKNPYLVAIDTDDVTFKCNCPSRKFPCKHALAFALYISANGVENAKVTDEPIWVQEWLDKRIKKKQAKVEITEQTFSKESVDKQIEKKFQQAVEDMLFLEHWLHDSVSSGLIEFTNKTESDWQMLQKRIVDFKLSGVNSLITQFQEVDYKESGWENSVLFILSKLNLLIQSMKQYKNFSEPFKSELINFLGWGMTKKQLLMDDSCEVVDDYWLVLKVHESKQESLTIRKVYLYGVEQKRWAYILEFAHGASYFEDFYKTGTSIQAKLVFYQGVLKLRAFIKVRGSQTDQVQHTINTFSSFHDTEQHFQEQRLLFPWIFEYPMMVQECNIISNEEQFFLIDSHSYLLLLKEFSFKDYVKILANSLGASFSAFFLHEEGGVRLMSIYQDKRVIAI